MRSYDYQRVSKTDDVVAMLSASQRPLAGGTDLMGLLKSGLVTPDALIDLKPSNLSASIEQREDGLHLGALTTLTRIATSDLVARHAPLLTQASKLAATTQIRNRATLAGNLMQAPRCWYFRDSEVDCWLKQSDEGSSVNKASGCPAETGRNEHHGIFPTGPCHAVHPSDLAPCLVALDAQLELTGRDGHQRRAVADLFAPPRTEHRSQTRLQQHELITGIQIPQGPAGRSGSVYLKAMDRKAWAFALVSTAVHMVVNNGQVVHLRVVLGGVAAIPWRLTALERSVTGTSLQDATLQRAIRQAMTDARPLNGNAYKVDLAEQLVMQAIQQAYRDAGADTDRDTDGHRNGDQYGDPSRPQ